MPNKYLKLERMIECDFSLRKLWILVSNSPLDQPGSTSGWGHNNEVWRWCGLQNQTAWAAALSHPLQPVWTWTNHLAFSVLPIPPLKMGISSSTLLVNGYIIIYLKVVMRIKEEDACKMISTSWREHHHLAARVDCGRVTLMKSHFYHL